MLVRPFLSGTKILYSVVLKKGNNKIRLRFENERRSDPRKVCGPSRAFPSNMGNYNPFMLNALTMLSMQEALEPSILCYHSSAYWEL